ncbi:hypothetical protein J7355_15720 [Endozoicomonas sp. G2_2]|uniref:hypothetical protein n=1 Tax=Endozoicomonas sp. G2_2 TaxID=2821092 RepID=UPI001ADBBCF9|nr:hypothetical protein [Endozoicomonas sp. G2_2]MBO9471538.1 hypothetical protein [Endozoicomonas sp. G2_2]
MVYQSRATRGSTFTAAFYRYVASRSELFVTRVTGDGAQPVVICETSYAFNPTRELDSTHRGSKVYRDHRAARRVMDTAAAKPRTICPKAQQHDIGRIFSDACLAPSPAPSLPILKHGGGTLAF